MFALHNHLSDAVSTKGLAANKGLASDSGQEVEDSRDGEYDGGGNQAGVAVEDTEEENDGHDSVRSGARIVCRDDTDGGIELAGGGADTEEQGNLDEQNDKGECTISRR